MIKWLKSIFMTDKYTRVVMMWNGRECQHWQLTDDDYEKLIRTALPTGFSIISIMDI